MKTTTIEQIKAATVTKVSIRKSNIDTINSYDTTESVELQLNNETSIVFFIHSKLYSNPVEWSFCASELVSILICENLTLTLKELMNLTTYNKTMNDLINEIVITHKEAWLPVVRKYETERVE